MPDFLRIIFVLSESALEENIASCYTIEIKLRIIFMLYSNDNKIHMNRWIQIIQFYSCSCILFLYHKDNCYTLFSRWIINWGNNRERTMHENTRGSLSLWGTSIYAMMNSKMLHSNCINPVLRMIEYFIGRHNVIED